MRIWHLGWEGTNDTLVACDARQCDGFAPSYVTQHTGEGGAQRMSGWVYLPDFDTAPGVHEPGPVVHAWFADGWYIKQSTLQLTRSVVLEVPEPEPALALLFGLLVLGALWMLRKR